MGYWMVVFGCGVVPCGEVANVPGWLPEFGGSLSYFEILCSAGGDDGWLRGWAIVVGIQGMCCWLVQRRIPKNSGAGG